MEDQDSSQTEKRRLIKELSRLQRETKLYAKHKDEDERKIENLEKNIENLEKEKFTVLDEISDVKCQLTIKDTELRRMKSKTATLIDQINTWSTRYKKLKEKMRGAINDFLVFYSAIDETISYYNESVLTYSSNMGKIIHNLISTDSFDFIKLKEEQVLKAGSLRINKEKLFLPNISSILAKKGYGDLIGNLKTSTRFYEDINFERLQIAYDRLLEESKNKGLEVNINDMSFLMDGNTTKMINGFKRNNSINSMNSSRTGASLFEDSVYDSVLLSDYDQSYIEASTQESSIADLIENMTRVKVRISNPESTRANRATVDSLIDKFLELIEALKVSLGDIQEDDLILQSPSLLDSNLQEGKRPEIPALSMSITTKMLASINNLKKLIYEEENRDKIGMTDLLKLEEALKKKNKLNEDWNAIQMIQVQLNTKIKTLLTFAADKECLLRKKHTTVQKLKNMEERLIENYRDIVSSAKVLEEERLSQENRIKAIKRDIANMTEKQANYKKEIFRLNDSMLRDKGLINTFKEDIKLLEAQLSEAKNSREEHFSKKEELRAQLESTIFERKRFMIKDIDRQINSMLETEKANILKTVSKFSDDKNSKAFSFISMKDLQRGVNSEAQAKSFANLLSTRIDKVIEEISTQGPILIEDCQEANKLTFSSFLWGLEALYLCFNGVALMASGKKDSITLMKNINDAIYDKTLIQTLFEFEGLSANDKLPFLSNFQKESISALREIN